MLWGFALCQCMGLLDSISDYYSLRTRDAFVGVLFVVAWFLFAYRGYERKDDLAGDLACLFALGVALFPNSGSNWEKVIHFSSAAAFFLVLSYFSLALFTKSGDSPTPEKKVRNRIYVTCGWVCTTCC
jgi:dolichyl-phosphate-mannose--protein O-mannosyl transferase